LIAAARNGDVAEVEKLIQKGCDVNFRDLVRLVWHLIAI
jgi:hypothetical protein